MNLHCSQTNNTSSLLTLVWYSYEFTLLSNKGCRCFSSLAVWYSYEFTLLSNITTVKINAARFDIPMNLHCSQTILPFSPIFLSLIFLWIYTALKLSVNSWDERLRLIFLWIYTALKLWGKRRSPGRSLIFLWIYTALKRVSASHKAGSVWYSYEFTLLSNRNTDSRYKRQSLIFLWIYTALKQDHDTDDQIKVWYSYEFTLLSNCRIATCNSFIVWYSYEFTLLSNSMLYCYLIDKVWYSYEFTLLSNLQDF